MIRKRFHKFFGKLGVVFVVVLILALPFGYCGAKHYACVDKDHSFKVLKSHGFENIQLKDTYQWFSCGDDDTYATGFVADNPRGASVEGTVCCGLWRKDCVIRF